MKKIIKIAKLIFIVALVLGILYVVFALLGNKMADKDRLEPYQFTQEELSAVCTDQNSGKALSLEEALSFMEHRNFKSAECLPPAQEGMRNGVYTAENGETKDILGAAWKLEIAYNCWAHTFIPVENPEENSTQFFCTGVLTFGDNIKFRHFVYFWKNLF